MAAVKVDPKKVHEHADAKSFYRWLGKNWNKETETWLRIFKVASKKKTVSPAEAIDAALCWGWIDGIRKSYDAESFLQRYSPRTKKSPWSQINVANVARLTKAGMMQPAGLAQVEAAKADGRWDNAYRMASAKPPPELVAALQKVPKALAFYETLSSQNRFALTFRVNALKTEAARARMIASFVAMLKAGKTIYPQAAPKKERPE